MTNRTVIYLRVLKEYPPSATLSSLQNYLRRYRLLVETGINELAMPSVAPTFVGYLFQLAALSVAKAGVQGLWVNAPTAATDLSAISWAE